MSNMEDRTSMDDKAIDILTKHIASENSHTATGVCGAIVDLLTSRLPNQPHGRQNSMFNTCVLLA